MRSNLPNRKEKMAALCLSTWSVVRSHRDARLLSSESWDQLAVSPQIIRGIDFSFLTTVLQLEEMESDSRVVAVNQSRCRTSVLLLKRVSNS